MPIQIEIPDDIFTGEQKEKLYNLFRVTNEEAFANALGRVVLAALDEYRDMFLGMGLPSRANEIREFRLYYLIKRYFNGRIPNELEISSMFQLPETRSKSLILYVLTRFRFNLEEEILNTLRNIVREAEVINEGHEYRVFIQSANMREELNRIIARRGVRYHPITNIRNEPNLFSIAPDSYEILRQHLGI